MEPGTLIRTLLTNAPNVVALVGYVDAVHGQQYRIYPLRAKQEVPRPYITYQLISDNPEGSDGCELDDEVRMQVSIFADSYDTLCTLSKAVRAKLHRYRSPGVIIERGNQFDHYDDAALCYHRTQDYLLELAIDAVAEVVVPPTPGTGYTATYPLAYPAAAGSSSSLLAGYSAGYPLTYPAAI